MQEDDRLADDLNADPVVFMDCTAPQILTCGAVSTVIGLALGLVGGIFLDAVMLGIVAGILIALGLSWLGLTIVQNLRNSFYDGWLNEKLFLLKHEFVAALGFVEYKLIRGSGRLGKGARK